MPWTFKFANQPPNPFVGGRKVTLTIKQDRWMHILKDHVCKNDGPWYLAGFPRDRVGRAAICCKATAPGGRPITEARGILSQLGTKLYASIVEPLVVRYVVLYSAQESGPFRPQRDRSWLVVLPFGAIAILGFRDGCETEGRVITCYFKNRVAKSIVKMDVGPLNPEVERRVKQLVIRQMVETYAEPSSENGTWCLPGQEYVTPPRSTKKQYRMDSNIEFSAPQKWGFADDNPGSRWCGFTDAEAPMAQVNEEQG